MVDVAQDLAHGRTRRDVVVKAAEPPPRGIVFDHADIEGAPVRAAHQLAHQQRLLQLGEQRLPPRLGFLQPGGRGHRLGLFQRQAAQAADPSGGIADRRIRERPPRILGDAVARHADVVVLHRRRHARKAALDHVFHGGPRIGPQRGQRAADRIGHAGPQHRAVGVVGKEPPLVAPQQVFGLDRRQKRIDHRQQQRIPILRMAQRVGRPVMARELAPGLPTLGKEGPASDRVPRAGV